VGGGCVGGGGALMCWGGGCMGGVYVFFFWGGGVRNVYGHKVRLDIIHNFKGKSTRAEICQPTIFCFNVVGIIMYP
jgi:hypothetical protein